MGSTLQNVKTKWMLGAGTSNPDTVSGLFDALTGLNIALKVADLANLVKLLSVDTLEQIRGLTELGIGQAMRDGSQANEALKKLQRIVQAHQGYSWWLRIDWQLVDNRTGKVSDYHSVEMFRGGPYGGRFGAPIGTSADGALLRSFEQRLLNELRATQTIRHTKMYTTR